MEKKYYTSPAVEVCRVQTTDIMATSSGKDMYIEMEIAEEEFNGEFRTKQGFFDTWEEE